MLLYPLNNFLFAGFELVETDADAHKNDSDIPEWIAKDEGKKLHSFILQVLKDLKTQHKTKYSRCVMDDSDEDSDDQDTHDGNSDGNSDSNTKSTDSGGTGESIKNEHTGSRTHKLKIKKSRGLMKRSTPVKSKHGSRDGVNNTNHRHKNEGNNDDEDTNLASDSGRHYAKIAHSIKYLQERKVQEIQALLLGDGNDDNNLHSANNRKKRNNRRGNVTAINAMNTSGGKEGSVGAENENQKLIGRIQAFARCAIINGKQVWTGERDGSILIRDARTARSVQRIETGDRLVRAKNVR